VGIWVTMIQIRQDACGYFVSLKKRDNSPECPMEARGRRSPEPIQSPFELFLKLLDVLPVHIF
jgi:hypothetical protein